MALFSLTLNQERKNSTHLLYDSLWPSISRKTLSLVRKTNKRACHFLWVIILILKYLWMGFSYLFCINYSYTNAFGPTERERALCVCWALLQGENERHTKLLMSWILQMIFFSLSLLVLGVIQLWALSNNQSTLIFRTIFPILIILPFVIIRIERDSPHRKRKIATFTIQLHASINIEGIKNIDFNLSLLSCCYHELVHFAMQPEIYQP